MAGLPLYLWDVSINTSERSFKAWIVELGNVEGWRS
jgi:hypothetical protein